MLRRRRLEDLEMSTMRTRKIVSPSVDVDFYTPPPPTKLVKYVIHPFPIAFFPSAGERLRGGGDDDDDDGDVEDAGCSNRRRKRRLQGGGSDGGGGGADDPEGSLRVSFGVAGASGRRVGVGGRAASAGAFSGRRHEVEAPRTAAGKSIVSFSFPDPVVYILSIYFLHRRVEEASSKQRRDPGYWE